MNILIACEESQAVTKEFRRLGYNAYSCDILDCSGGHPEWHIKGDVIPLLNGSCTFNTVDGSKHNIYYKWDMIIAFPPCTDLCVSGARHFKKKQENGQQQKAIEFFMKFTQADCNKIAIENPIGIMSNLYKKPTQIIHPWHFGDAVVKSTCLWLKGLEPLKKEVEEVPEIEYFEFTSKKGVKKRQTRWYYEALKLKPEERARVRSKTFQGIARAMAEQWGNSND